MRSEIRTSGIFASGAFLIVGVGGYITTLNAFQSILYGLAASLVLAFLGYRIAFILSHPEGRSSRGQGLFGGAQLRFPSPPGMAADPASTPITGEETFLDDIETSDGS